MIRLASKNVKCFSQHYKAKLCTGLAHNSVSVCSWIPETSLKAIENFVGTIKQDERIKKRTIERDLVAESTYKSQVTQFGLVMSVEKN